MAHILILEDEEDLADIFSMLLEGAGHDVKSSASVRGAKELLAAGKFDLIVSDLNLVDGTPIEVLGGYLEKDPTAVLIVLTGDSSEFHVEKLNFPVQFILEKPVRNKAFLQVVSEGLDFRSENVQAI